MKRLHISFTVADLDASVAFYSRLFDAAPSLRRGDYAKWMLEDPKVNFVVETAGEATGFSHAGIQVESEAELEEVFTRMKASAAPVLEEGVTTCCYHESEKTWAADPDGVMWEAFFTHHETEQRNAVSGAREVPAPASASPGGGCCV